VYKIIKNIMSADYPKLSMQEKEDYVCQILSLLVEIFNKNGYKITNEYKLTFSEKAIGAFNPNTLEMEFNNDMINNPINHLATIFHEFKHLAQRFPKNGFKGHTSYTSEIFEPLFRKLVINNFTPEELKAIANEPDQRIKVLAKRFPKCHYYLKHFFKYYYLQDYEIDARNFAKSQVQKIITTIKNDQELSKESKQKWIEVLSLQLNNVEEVIIFGEDINNFNNNTREKVKEEIKQLVIQFFDKNPNFFENINDSNPIILMLYGSDLRFLSSAAIFLADDKKIIQKIFNGFLSLDNKDFKILYLESIYKICGNVLTKKQINSFKLLVGEDKFEQLTATKNLNNKYLNSLTSGTISTVTI